MLFATMGQGALAVWMMACGAAMYLLALLFSGLRHLMQAGPWLNFLLDLLLGALWAGVFIAFLVGGNYGRVRLFEILAAALGALIAHLALSFPLKRIGKALRRIQIKISTGLKENRLIKVIFR